MFNFRNILFLLAILILILSCYKDEPESIPEIKIYAPAENELFGVSDTIPVQAMIIDERIISNVQVVLVSEDFTPVAKTYSFHPNSTEYNLDMNYYTEDVTLEDGNYYILVKAENESKFKNKYTKIRIAGESLRLEKVVVVSGSGENITVNGIDSTQTASVLFSIDCNYAASDVSSRLQQFYLAGKIIVDLKTFSMPDYSVDWSIEPVMTPPLHNDNCLYAGDYIFATYNLLYIRGYDSEGGVVFTTGITSHDKPGAVIRLNDYVLVDMQKQNTSATTELVTYYFASGIKTQSRQTQFEVSGFFRHSDEKVFITANNGNAGKLFIYNVKFDAIEHLADLPGRIVSSDLIDSDRVLIGTENDLYLYNYSTLQLISFMDNIAVEHISFEALNSDLYISSAKELRRFRFPEMQLKNTYLFEDTIKNVHLLYNK